MSFQMPNFFTGDASGFQVAGASMANARATQQALQAQTAEMQRLLMLGKDIPCPYCSQLIAKDALVCSSCQGNLGIGSWTAVRAALMLDPLLAHRDSETLVRLQTQVKQIEEWWAEEQRQEVERQAQAARERQAEADRQAELARIKAAEIREKEQARLAAMSPMRRWLITNRALALTAGVALILLLSLIAVLAKQNSDQSAALAKQTARDACVAQNKASSSLVTVCGLSGIDLTGADLSKANFSGQTLSNMRFAGADLTQANFTNANLSGADLRGGNFSQANFENANFANANLYGANLAGANFKGADYSNTTCPDRTNSDGDLGGCSGHGVA
jgi:uncharacterized protein YjbI with pentapeptide repeats